MARVFYLPHPLQVGFMHHLLRCLLPCWLGLYPSSSSGLAIISFWLRLNGILNFNDHKCKLILNALLWLNLCLVPASWLLFVAFLHGGGARDDDFQLPGAGARAYHAHRNYMNKLQWANWPLVGEIEVSSAWHRRKYYKKNTRTFLKEINRGNIRPKEPTIISKI